MTYALEMAHVVAVLAILSGAVVAWALSAFCFLGCVLEWGGEADRVEARQAACVYWVSGIVLFLLVVVLA